MLQSNRRKFLQYCAAGGAAAVLPWQIQNALAADAGKELSFGIRHGFSDLNPLKKLVHSFQYMLFDGLTAIDPTTREAVPGLAESWKHISDLEVEFTLRDGVNFSNGSPMTAADVVFTIETILGEKLSHSSLLSTIKSAEILDESTVKVTTKGPDPLLTKRVAMLFVVSRAAYEAAGTDKFGLNPIGTGQYKMAELTPGSSFTLTGVKDNWRGAPATETVRFKIYKDGVLTDATIDATLKGPASQ